MLLSLIDLRVATKIKRRALRKYLLSFNEVLLATYEYECACVTVLSTEMEGAMFLLLNLICEILSQLLCGPEI
jgi:hypothetical protein